MTDWQSDDVETADEVLRSRNRWRGIAESQARELATLWAGAATAAWQPIETAPKDGTRIAAWCVHPTAAVAERSGGDRSIWEGPVIAQWIDHNGGGWTWHGLAGALTGWMPLPSEAPRGDTSGEQR